MPIEIPDDASPLRFLSESEYVCFPNLEEARKNPHAAMIMEGDYGGQIYLTCPVVKIICVETALQDLLNDVTNLMCWEGERIYYEPRPVGSSVAGGMGGGEIIDGVWVHDYFEIPFGVAIREVIEGKVSRIWEGEIDTIKPFKGSSLLVFAIENGVRELFDYVLNGKNCDVTIKYSNNEYSLLHLAAEQLVFDSYFIERLLKAGLDPQAKAFRDAQPLHIAARCGSLGAVKQLLKHGADINAKDKFDYTPLDYAETFNSKDEKMIALLKSHGGVGQKKN